MRVGAVVGDVEAGGAREGALHLDDDLHQSLAAHGDEGIREYRASQVVADPHLSSLSRVGGSILGDVDDGEDEVLRGLVNLLLRLRHIVVSLVPDVDMTTEPLAVVGLNTLIVFQVLLSPLVNDVGVPRLEVSFSG